MDDISDDFETEALPLYLSSSPVWSLLRGDERRQIFEHTSGARVFVPMQRRSDFSFLAVFATNEIAAAENRTPQDVAVDMVWMRFDKLHVHREAQTSSLPYSAGIELHLALGDLILAAARAASEPRAAYVGGRHPHLVDAYLDRVRMIPSETGSFVVRALLPLVWGENELTLDLVGPANETVRRVSTTILRAANAAITTAQEIVSGETMNHWDAAVEQGVSANLCDALTSLVGHGTGAGKVELRISWTWAKPAQPVSAVEIPVDLAPVLEAGADYLRGQPDEHTVRITGLVTVLHRESATGPGEITVRGYIEGFDASYRILRCELDENSYRSAISAHEDGHTVTVSAFVRREPRRLNVLYVEDFHVLADY